MDNPIPNVRFVRCPKCLKLIPEYANIAVYRCGGCGTVLRAKYYIASAENATSVSLENSSQNLSVGVSSSGLISSREQMITSSPEVDDGTEQKAASSNCISESISRPISDKRGDNSDHGKISTEGRATENGSPTQTNQADIEIYTNLDKGLEESLKLSPEGQDNLRQTDSTKEFAEPISQYIVSEQDAVIREPADLPVGSWRSDNRSSHAYDASASSADDSCSDHIPRKKFLLSKRTYRHKKSAYTSDSKGKKAIGDSLVNNMVTTDADLQPQAQNHSARASGDTGASAIVGSPDSNRAEWLSRDGIHSLDQEMSFNSEDFQSVENWMEPETDSSLSRKSDIHRDALDGENDKPSVKLAHVKPKHMEILKKVDELRYELTELFDQTVQGKRRSYLRGIREEDSTDGLGSDSVPFDPSAYLPKKDVHQRAQFSRAPFAGCHQFPCLHCRPEGCQSSIQPPSNVCLHCHPPNSASPVHIASGLPPHGDKVQASNHELENLNKQKRQAMRRYCLPIAGGAPFVICYNCLRLLQLPADFLVSRKRMHKLQCGSCFEVLIYSFRQRPQWTPQTPIEVQHPPSEVESNPNVILRHQMPTSHPNDYPHGDPISFNEEYGLSFARSDSTEPEPVLHVSRNSSELSEAQNPDRLKGSQLHRLLGYASASEILFQVNASEGSQSTAPTTPDFHRPFQESYTRYGLNITGLRTSSHEHSEAGMSSNNPGTRVEDVSPRRSRIRRGASPLRGLLKKGIRELNHGLESVKQKVQSNGRKVQA